MLMDYETGNELLWRLLDADTATLNRVELVGDTDYETALAHIMWLQDVGMIVDDSEPHPSGQRRLVEIGDNFRLTYAGAMTAKQNRQMAEAKAAAEAEQTADSGLVLPEFVSREFPDLH